MKICPQNLQNFQRPVFPVELQTKAKQRLQPCFTVNCMQPDSLEYFFPKKRSVFCNLVTNLDEFLILSGNLLFGTHYPNYFVC